MTKTMEAVTLSVLVPMEQDAAFELFTDRFAVWWPKHSHHISEDDAVEAGRLWDRLNPPFADKAERNRAGAVDGRIIGQQPHARHGVVTARRRGVGHPDLQAIGRVGHITVARNLWKRRAGHRRR